MIFLSRYSNFVSHYYSTYRAMESLKTLQPEPSPLYLQVVNVTFKILRKAGHLSAVVFVKVSYESMYASALVMVSSHGIHIHI